MMHYGLRLKRVPGTFGTVGFGLSAGLMTGATSAGWPPAVIYYFSGPLSVAIGRASLIAFLGAVDLLASGMAAYEGLIVGETLVRMALALPPMLAGAWLGARAFHLMAPDLFRRWVIIVLALLSVVSLGQALAAMAR